MTDPTRTVAVRRYGSSLRDRFRALPRALRLVLAAHVLLLCFYTVLFPNYRAPDEPQHVDMIAASEHGRLYPWPDPGTYKVGLGSYAGSTQDNGRIPERRVQEAADAPPRSDRRTYDHGGGDKASRNPNQLIQHPPLYYYGLAPVLMAIPHWETQPMDRVVGILRLVNVLLMAPLPLIAYALARKLGLLPQVAVAASAFVLAVPQAYHVGAAVNNDNLLIPLLGLASLGTAMVARGDLRLKTAVFTGVVMGLALLTKGLALYLPLTVFLAFLIAAFRVSFRRAVVPAAVSLGLGFVIGGWWWVRNQLKYGRIQPPGNLLSTVGPSRPHTTFRQSGEVWGKEFLRFVNQRFWIEPQVLKTLGIVNVAVVTAFVVFAICLVITLVRRSPRLPDQLLLIIPVVALLGIVASGSWATYKVALKPAAEQGRYLFGAIPAMSVLAVAGISGVLKGRLRGVLPLLVLVGAAGMQLVMFVAAMRAYWFPVTGSPLHRLVQGSKNLLAWSPFPDAAVVIVVLALLATYVWTCVVAARSARSWSRSPVPV